MTTAPPPTTTTTPTTEQGKVVRAKPRVKKSIALATVVGPKGVPKLLTTLSNAPFPENANKKNLQHLLSICEAWGRTVGPGFEFEEFALKLEKFSGAHAVRRMLDALRRGEDLSEGFEFQQDTNPQPTKEPSEENSTTGDGNKDNNDNNNNNHNNDNKNDNAAFDDINFEDDLNEFESSLRPPTTTAPTPTPALTQGELDRIERNRQEAVKRRQQREHSQTDNGITPNPANDADGDKNDNSQQKTNDSTNSKTVLDDDGDNFEINIEMDNDVSHADSLLFD